MNTSNPRQSPSASFFVLRAIFAGLALAMIAQAHAASLADRLYLGADVGIAQRKLNGTLLKQPQTHPASSARFRDGSSESRFYTDARIGFEFTDFFAIEAGYQDFGKTKVRIVPPPYVDYIQAPPSDFVFRDRAFTLDPVLTWKVKSRVKLHAFWGVAFARSTVSIENYRPVLVIFPTDTKNSRTTESRAGVNADVELAPKWDLHAGGEYQRFTSFAKEGWLWHLGLAYTF